MAKKTHDNNGSRGPNTMMLRRTLFLLIVCGIVAFIVLGARLFKLQILQHDELESMAVEQQVRETTVTANRGTIYDCNRKIMAMSASVETIYISPAEIAMYEEDVDLIATKLSAILGVDYDSIVEKANDRKKWYKVISRKVERDVADQIREFKKEYNIVGVKIESDTKRYYPYGSLACHVVGYVGMENYGLNGIELTFDEKLTGENGRIVRAKNASGTDMLFTNFEDYYDAVDGNSLVLTIDSTIQYYVEKHLQQAAEDYQLQNGAAAIAMDVNTGEIKALASLGNFDLNNYQAVSDSVLAQIEAAETDEEKAAILSAAQNLQWRNKAISDTYEPGSTFKILTLSMGLEEGVISENDHFYCGGSISVTGDSPGAGRNCWKTGGHGDQTTTQALQHSCNVAFINIGLKVGAENFYKYAKAFGLFEKTNIDLPGESGSIWWSEELFYNPYNKTQLAAASFGQTFNVTPLQMITAISACCNGGNLMKPYLVKEVLDEDGNVISKTEPQVVRQVISEKTSSTVCTMLEQVVDDKVEGTGKNAYVAGYRIGGKTGTSTNTVVEAATGQKKYIVSFVGIAPADDPQIAILVLLDCPDDACGVYVSGGQMAAPTVGAIFADVLPYMGVEAVYTEEEIASLDKTVPNMKGMTLAEAEALLTEQHLTYRVVGAGAEVTSQLPAPNAVVAAESQIILYADSEPSAELEEVPDLVGLSYSIARQRMGYYALFVNSATGLSSGSESLQVTKQSIPAGTMVEHGTVVEVSLVDNSELGRY